MTFLLVIVIYFQLIYLDIYLVSQRTLTNKAQNLAQHHKVDVLPGAQRGRLGMRERRSPGKFTESVL